MSDIQFNCPKCGHNLVVDSQGAGMAVPCPECHEQITIPGLPPPMPERIDLPRREKPSTGKGNRLAVIGLVLGIMGLWFMGFLAAIPAVICAHVARARALKSPTGQDKGMATAGLAVGYLAIVVSLFMGSCGLVGGKMWGSEGNAGMKSATMRAWQGLQEADNRLGGMQFDTVSSHLRQQAYLYSLVDLSDVDPILQKHFQDCISTVQSAAQLAAESESNFAAIQQNTEAAAGLGSMIGSAASDGYNPQGDAAAGALLFGLIGAAAQQEDYERLKAQYGPVWNQMWQRLQALNDADKRVAAELTRKYDVPFTDPF